MTADGLYLFAGGRSVKMYVWELSTGSLLNAWNGHYKSVTNLKMDASGMLLVSGGDDAMMHLWLLPQLLDPDPGHAQQPYHSWYRMH